MNKKYEKVLHHCGIGSAVGIVGVLLERQILGATQVFASNVNSIGSNLTSMSATLGIPVGTVLLLIVAYAIGSKVDIKDIKIDNKHKFIDKNDNINEILDKIREGE